ncbi:MAG TPA: hypothetical protein VK666_21830 [Chryseolinea sp.]|nr:hypothetical protein [Chryseolinea sp.]
MRKFICLAGLTLLFSHVLLAQDEGTIVKRERIDRSQGIFLGFGPSFTLGKNIGDYSTGLNLEAGFLKRLNRVFSIGPSLSYIKFKYDPAKTKAETAADLYVGNTEGTNIDLNGWHAKYDPLGLPPDYDWQYGYLLQLEGGDISLFSLALNLKINFIPITDKTKFSFYGFAKPFITSAKRDDVSGVGTRYVYEAYEDKKNTTTVADDVLTYAADDNIWHPDGKTDPWGPGTQFPALNEETKISGGIFLGPGVEFMPAAPFSFFFQVSFGYTFPISYVSTESYPKTIDSYVNDEFPIVNKGFPSVNIQFGASLNF